MRLVHGLARVVSVLPPQLTLSNVQYTMPRIPAIPLLPTLRRRVSRRNRYFALLVLATVVAAVSLAEGLMADAAGQTSTSKIVQSIVRDQDGVCL